MIAISPKNIRAIEVKDKEYTRNKYIYSEKPSYKYFFGLFTKVLKPGFYIEKQLLTRDSNLKYDGGTLDEIINTFKGNVFNFNGCIMFKPLLKIYYFDDTNFEIRYDTLEQAMDTAQKLLNTTPNTIIIIK